jgi:hypothetical protein
VFFEERESVFNGNGRSWRGIRLSARLGQRYWRTAQPKTFHEADDRARVGVHDRRAALAFHHWMAEEEDVSGWGRLYKLRRFESKDSARGRVFALRFEALRIPKLLGVERKCEHGLSPNDGASS